MTKAPTVRQFSRSFGSGYAVSGRWSGDAYGYHPHGVIMRPMIYRDHHNVNGYCDAAVMTVPNTELKPWGKGRDASTGRGGLPAYPRPVEGEFVTIYRNGEWVGEDGPWRQTMRNDMAAVLWQIRRIRRDEKMKRRQDALEREAKTRKQFEDARSAFSGN